MTLAEWLASPDKSWQTLAATLPASERNMTEAQTLAKMAAATAEINRLDYDLGLVDSAAQMKRITLQQDYWGGMIHAWQYVNSPGWAAQYNAVAAANNAGDWVSGVGDTFVSLVPTALIITAAVAGADLIMGGTLISSAAAPAVAATGSTTASAAVTTSQGVIAEMTGAGISDAVIAQSAAQAAASAGVASAAAATAEMTAATWATLATGETMQALSVSGLLNNIPNVPSAPTAPTPTPSQPLGIPQTVYDVARTVAPTALDVAGKIALTEFAQSQAQKNAQAAPVTTQGDIVAPNNNFLYAAAGIVGVAVLAVVLKKKG